MINFRQALFRSSAFLKKVWVIDLFSFLFALVVFVLILINLIPGLTQPLSFKARTGFTGFIPFFVLAFYASLRLPRSVGRFLTLALTFSVFALSLSGLWTTGQSQSTVFNGIVPLSDASGYYLDSLRLILGQDISDFSARRPLFPGFFAVLLSISHHNLMVPLGILTTLMAGSVYLAAKEIHRTHGAEVATFAAAVLFLYCRYNNGLVMSESLGIPLGLLGFTLIWRGAAAAKPVPVLVGFFTCTLALNVRAGAFFVLPFLLVWGGWVFRRPGTWLSWRFILAGVGAVLGGFLVNWLVFRSVAASSGVLFSNFSYSLYGLASGGRDWKYVLSVHPELLKMHEPALSRLIYQLAFEQILHYPGLLLQGILYNYRQFFANTMYGVYSYIARENDLVNPMIYWGMYLLCLLGIVRWLRKPSDPFSSLVVAAACGILISVPFLPPTDAYRMRPYAASMIFSALLPAMGLLFVLDPLKARLRWISGPDSSIPDHYGLMLGSGLILLLVMTVGPLTVKSLGESPRAQGTSCPDGHPGVVTRFDAGTYFNILPDENSSIPDGMPDFHWSVYKRNAHSLADSNFINWAIRIKPGVSIFDALNYRNNQFNLIVSPSRYLPAPGSVIEICGYPETDPRVGGYSIFYTESIHVLKTAR